ncbi:hypothetical protein [Youngiibacter multivorans]|uniref:RNA polymerase alpha subunit C-terminal domain-containing protein n=1 Tax=Youngiibacter multivorans TaxID=937251 RepID=A0ABS4G3X0_9CLOT|nr:hypothetical protein [Youngiibacter multivorans]MBP1919238.1 hypothetical protein [Youngiibacter multivorans]
MEKKTGFPDGIGRPAGRALEGESLRSLEDLQGISEKELLRLHGIGKKAMGILKAAMEEKGLSLKVDS